MISNGLYHSEQIRQIERQAMDTLQLDEYALMERAGTEAFQVIMKRYAVSQVALFCGAGNNAGDGYVLARLLKEAGIGVSVCAMKAPENLPIFAAYAARLAQEAGVTFQDVDEIMEGGPELLVDALLGIGIRGAPRGAMITAIHQINDSPLPVVSLDLPSGLDADTGEVPGICVQAQLTLTFIAPKMGLYTLDGPDYAGEIHCCTLQLESMVKTILPRASLLEGHYLPLPRRQKNSHKGLFGHVLIVGGDTGMPGAVAMAAKACLRSGAGLVSIATRMEHAKGQLTAFIPEAMVHGIEDPEDLYFLMDKASVCILGPGLGDSEWSEDMFTAALTSSIPMVIDASALRWLAAFPQQDDNWVLTPHPGEAAALMNTSTKTIQQDRYTAALDIQQQYGGVIVLKGCGTIIQDLDNKTSVCARGNPGMASAGMGDVLSGVIAALIAQGCSLSKAARMGVLAHALAGDKVAAQQGERGLLASDVIHYLPKILNGKLS